MKALHFTFYLVVVAVLLTGNNGAATDALGMGRKNLANERKWMAIIGDSAVTGAVSSPSINATFKNLQARLWDALSPSWKPIVSQNSPTRIFFSSNEMQNFWTRPFLNLVARVSTQTDFPESSFGTLVGQGLQIDPLDVVLVGQNSVMVQAIPVQFARIFEIQTKTLPPIILLSFNANDFCDPKVFSQEAIQPYFQNALQKAWDDSRPFLRPHPQGTKIFVLAPLDVSNILSNPSIQERVIEMEGQGKITCGQVRRDQLQAGVKAWVMRQTLAMMCPSVTAPTSAPEHRVKTVQEVQQAINEIWKRQIDRLNQTYANANIRWQYLETIRDIKFTGEDIGNDCFHPSISGHQKIAAEVLRSIKN